LDLITYLIGEPDMRRTFRFLNLLGSAVLLIFEQEDDSMHWFGQNSESIVVDAKDLMDSEMANTDILQNGSEEGLKRCKLMNIVEA
jgi:hypothetical protein